MSDDSDRATAVVVGGGISGLAAAWHLCRPNLARTPGARSLRTRVIVVDGGSELGGKIRTTEFAGSPVDEGPDAFLARAPWATHLCHEIGIGDFLVSPAKQHAFVWSRGHLHRFPSDTILGVPGSLPSVARSQLVSKGALLRAAADMVLPWSVGRQNDDPTVAELIGARLGKDVLDRLVDPLLGSINAGPVDQMSLTSVAPQLAEIASRRASLLLAVGDQLRRRDPEEIAQPVFYAPPGGMATLVTELCEQLRATGVDLRTSTTVESLRRNEDGRWQLGLSNSESIEADAVLLATPAPVTAAILRDLAPQASSLLDTIQYASVALVRMAYASADLPAPLDGTGFVVPSADRRLLTACSWASSKWEHLDRPGQVIVRASAGRMGDDRALQLSDEELTTALHQELAQAIGVRQPPFAADVTRWTGSFPQYTPGHEAKVVEIQRAVAALGAIAVAGAAYRGLGIPSCVRNGTDAAEQLLATLASTTG